MAARAKRTHSGGGSGRRSGAAGAGKPAKSDGSSQAEPAGPPRQTGQTGGSKSAWHPRVSAGIGRVSANGAWHPRVGRPRVVGVGLCVEDHLFVVDDYRLPEVRTRYSDALISPGGMVSTAIGQAAALGCDARLLTMVGDDGAGRAVTRTLRTLGVNTRGVVRSPDHPTTTAVVLVDRRTRDRRFLLPDRRALERSAPDFDLRAIRPPQAGTSARGPCTILLVDGHFPAQAKRAVLHARAMRVPVVADFATPRGDFLRLLPHVDFPVLPLEFVAAWGVGGPRETLRALHERFGGTPVITLGARGAMILIAGKIHAVAAPRVRVLDTTGAGDVLHGSFAAALSQGRAVLPALRSAVREASRACGALGGLGRMMQRVKTRPLGARRLR